MERIPHIAILLGTARTGRNSEHVANYITEIVQADDRVDAALYDVRDFMTDRTIPDWQPDGETSETQAWREVAAKADAFIMVVPEYNSSYPGEWKLVVDQASKEYVGKPVITAGVSNGPFMGARMTEHIRPILTRLGFISLHAPLYFGMVKDFIAADKTTRDEQYKERIEKSLNTLLVYEARLHGIQDELV